MHYLFPSFQNKFLDKCFMVNENEFTLFNMYVKAKRIFIGHEWLHAKT